MAVWWFCLLPIGAYQRLSLFLLFFLSQAHLLFIEKIHQRVISHCAEAGSNRECRAYSISNTSFRLFSTSCMTLGRTFLTCLTRNCLSKVIICEIFRTESLGRPDSLADKKIFPGASAKRVFEVITMQIMVLILL